jgi:phospholipase/carboxylesterase
MEKEQFGIESTKYKIQSIQDTIILTPKNEDYLKVIIFFIGFGDTVTNFIKEFLKLSENLEKVKIIILGAKKISISALKNELHYSWYDFKYNILSNIEDNICESDLLKLIPKIKNIINSEIKLGKEIYLSGFSQGGSVAIYLGTIFALSINGVILFSSFFFNLTKHALSNFTNFNIAEFKIILFHGVLDENIPKEASIEIKQHLEDINKKKEIFNVIYKEFKSGHTIINEELIELNKLLNNI